MTEEKYILAGSYEESDYCIWEVISVYDQKPDADHNLAIIGATHMKFHQQAGRQKEGIWYKLRQYYEGAEIDASSLRTYQKITKTDFLALAERLRPYLNDAVELEIFLQPGASFFVFSAPINLAVEHD